MSGSGGVDNDGVARVYLGLGSNMGDRAAQLRAAVAGLAADADIEVVAASPVYETEYVGLGEQQPYLNACIRIETRLAPDALLARLQERERLQGRLPDSHMQPRPLDLDILLWDDREIETESLIVPHPGLTQRAFVLEPLCCLAPDLVVPGAGRSVAELRAEIRRRTGPWIRAWTGTA